MSVLFGRWNWEGESPSSDYMERVLATLSAYGPDSNGAYANTGLRIVYRAFYATAESRLEVQPHVGASGAVITWDGRLDNRHDLIGELRVPMADTDIAIVAAAYERWGTGCFAKLIGDWAVSIWSPTDRSLILAKDYIGTRHLYYSFDRNQVAWSTLLAPLVMFRERNLRLSEEYIAGWFAGVFPGVNATPYADIYSVPPASFVRVVPGKHHGSCHVSKYWDFNAAKRICYRTDAEYEEHFRALFATAVQRRLRADRPVLADLSGGMDSSSIVCMADKVIASGQAECPRLDTITWYDECRPNWGERPYFAQIEAKRGRTGHHLDVATSDAEGPQTLFETDCPGGTFAAAPILDSGNAKLSHWFSACLRSGGYRVRLSGVGGEEPTGGNTPTPIPELQDLLVRLHLFTLVGQLNAWSLKMRTARLLLLWNALREFFPPSLQGRRESVNPAPRWLHSDFIRRNRKVLQQGPRRIRVVGALPSFQQHLHALELERGVMAHLPLRPDMLHETRYPYHDRDLREFAYSIPCEQLVRVGQRRSLMRRALVGIVPDELLNRKPKPIAPSHTKSRFATQWPLLSEMGNYMMASALEIIDPARFEDAMRTAPPDEEAVYENLGRTLRLERWLRQLQPYGTLKSSVSLKNQERGEPSRPRAAHKFS